MSWLRKTLARKLPPDELNKIPRGFERIGHIVILPYDRELEPYLDIVSKELLKVGGVRTVAIRRGPVRGWMRTPTIEVIAGDSSTETLHMENGCFYKLDVARVMFSKGNVYERQRIAQLVQDGEVVVDLFAGIGQFSIQIGKHARPKRVYAVEKNLVAYRYLCDNIRINKLGHVVIPLHGDCRDVAPRGTADRVIMGILHVGHLYLPLALDVLKDKGGVIHYHETAPRKLGFSRALERIAKAAGEREVEILEKRVVKRYAPGVDHLVVDALIGPRKTLR